MKDPLIEYTAYLINSELDICSKMVNKIESMFRNSFENKGMIQVLRLDDFNNQDLLYEEYDFENRPVQIDFHHPFRLYNIVKVAIRELLDLGYSNITTAQVVDKVIEYHYQGIIPYVFLAKTTHDLHHDGQFVIDKKYIKGNYEKFIVDKYKYFDDEDKNMIKEYLYITEEDISELIKQKEMEDALCVTMD